MLRFPKSRRIFMLKIVKLQFRANSSRFFKSLHFQVSFSNSSTQFSTLINKIFQEYKFANGLHMCSYKREIATNEERTGEKKNFSRLRTGKVNWKISFLRRSKEHVFPSTPVSEGGNVNVYSILSCFEEEKKGERKCV